MAKSYTRDMTEGSIWKHLIAFSLPMLAGNIFQQFYNLVDSIIVGRYVGGNALGAVGSVGSLNFLFFSLCLGLASGVRILVSQLFGAKKEEEAKRYIAHAVYVTLAAGILMSLLGSIFAEPILHFMNTPAETYADALIYMRLVCGFTFVVACYNSISAVLQALGDSKTPLIFLIVASVINIILDLLFVVVFRTGVAGAAIATVIAQGVSAVGAILFGVNKNEYLQLNKKHFEIDMDIIKKEITVGIPLAIQTATIAVSCVALQRVVNRFGATVMAAYTASNRIEQIVQQPFNSIGMALSTFAGQNYGARNKKRINQSAMDGMILDAFFSAIMIAVMFLLGENIVSIFITDPAVIKIGALGLRITSLMYFFLGMIYVMRGLLNGVGDVAFCMMNGIGEVVCRIGFAYLLIYMFSMDYMAVWYTNGFTWTVVGILSLIRFIAGKWKKGLEN